VEVVTEINPSRRRKFNFFPIHPRLPLTLSSNQRCANAHAIASDTTPLRTSVHSRSRTLQPTRRGLTLSDALDGLYLTTISDQTARMISQPGSDAVWAVYHVQLVTWLAHWPADRNSIGSKIHLSWKSMIASVRAGVKCRCADVPTCKMRTDIADITCGCDGWSSEVRMLKINTVLPAVVFVMSDCCAVIWYRARPQPTCLW